MFSALITFATIGLITPGPNNIMLMSSGTNFGYKKSLPHMIGITLGFAIMILVVGLGLSKIFDTYPIVKEILQIVCIIYLVYLSYKISASKKVKKGVEKVSAPMTLLQASLFQWVNPKAWSMSITATSLYSSSHSLADTLGIVMVFACINIISASVWILSGVQISKLLHNDKYYKYFNIFMGVMLLSTLIFLI